MKDSRLFISDKKESIFNCYTEEQINEVSVVSTEELLENHQSYENTEYIFSTWGMPRFNEVEIHRYLPKLKAVFYAAGSVGYFAKPYLESGVRVFSAWKVNAIPVAEFTVAQIILANKGYFQTTGKYRDGFKKAVEYSKLFPGNYHTSVGLLGLGMISKKVIELLKPYNLEVHVASKHLDEKEAEKLGVKRADMEEIFSHCSVISNHLANKEENREILNYSLFGKMRDNATFINTGRGAEVNVTDLIRAMREKPDRTALLDVTDPKEPLDQEDEMWSCPNIFVTPHRAGSTSQEVYHMGEEMLDEYNRYLNGKTTTNEVTLDMLKTMA